MRTALCVGLLALTSCSPPRVADSDVSMLVPLGQAASVLSATTAGGDAAALLPRSVFDALHALTVTDEPDQLYGSLAAVAIRLDACFQEGSPASACRPQVRLVFQPTFLENGQWTTRDAAVHLFFDVPEAELLKAVTAITQARALTGAMDTGPLVPGAFAHPAFVSKLMSTLRPLLRNERIGRVTAMSVHASNQAWIFSGFEIKALSLTPISIPTLGAVEEHHVTNLSPGTGLELTLEPQSLVETQLPPLLEGTARQQASQDALSAAVAAIARLEDPGGHNPGTVDCASCHVAAVAQRFVRANYPTLTLPAESPASESYEDTRNLRAFGYFFAAPAVSPRVLRETTAVRADISRRLGE